MSIGQRLQELMYLKKISQSEMARATGINRSMLSEWCSDKVKPGKKSIGKICDYFDCYREWLEHGRGPVFTTDPSQSTEKDEVNLDHEAQSFSIKEMVGMTLEVLESDTVYKAALASNIRAFHKAVTMEEEMEQVKKQLDGMDDRMHRMGDHMQRMEELLLSLGATLPEKREASNA